MFYLSKNNFGENEFTQKGEKVKGLGGYIALLTIESGNPPSSILSALNATCSSSLSLASFCLAAL